jgi:hypothetical protein
MGRPGPFTGFPLPLYYGHFNFDMGMASHSKKAAFVPIRPEQVSTNIHTAHLFVLQNECFQIKTRTVHASEAGPAVSNLCPARSFCAAVTVMSLQLYSMWPGSMFKNFLIGVCYSWMVKENIRTYVNKDKSCNKSLNLISIVYLCVGWDNVVVIATCYRLDVPGIEV